VKKTKDQIQQELELVQGDQYRESAPSKISGKNKKLKSLRSKLKHLTGKLEHFTKRRNEKAQNKGYGIDILNSIVSSYTKQVKKVQEEVDKLEKL
jgi:uncharacterized coiled-coil protein SlyX